MNFEPQDIEYIKNLAILNGMTIEKFIMRCVAEFQSPDRDDNLADFLAFEVFWTKYPKKEAKEPARKSWGKLKPNHFLTEKIMKALEVHKQSKSWKSGFVPMASTWLNQKRFNDEGIKSVTGATIESKYDSPDVLKARQAAKKIQERYAESQRR